jgi:TolA-binding protein
MPAEQPDADSSPATESLSQRVTRLEEQLRQLHLEIDALKAPTTGREPA